MNYYLVDNRDIEITGLLDQNETPNDGACGADPTNAQPRSNGLSERSEIDNPTSVQTSCLFNIKRLYRRFV
jgi:hypothetical protein